MNHILLCDLLKPIVIENHLIRPRPTVFTVVIIDFRKAVEQLLDVVNITVVDITDETHLLTLRHQQTTEIRPSTLTYGTLGPSEEAFLLGTLQHGTHIDTQGNIIVLQTLTQGRGIDHILMEIIRRDIITGSLTQGLQHLDTLHDLTDGKR